MRPRFASMTRRAIPLSASWLSGASNEPLRARCSLIRCASAGPMYLSVISMSAAAVLMLTGPLYSAAADELRDEADDARDAGGTATFATGWIAAAIWAAGAAGSPVAVTPATLA